MATAKQTAALAKARAARKKATVAKVTKKLAAPKDDYVVKVVTTKGKVGYYAGASGFDDDIGKAVKGAKRVMDNYAALVFAMRPAGIKSVEVVKK